VPRPRSQARPLAFLFGLLGLALLAIAVYAALAGVWLVTAAAGVLALWMGELAVRSIR
jgi:hypothetical protein